MKLIVSDAVLLWWDEADLLHGLLEELEPGARRIGSLAELSATEAPIRSLLVAVAQVDAALVARLVPLLELSPTTAVVVVARTIDDAAELEALRCGVQQILLLDEVSPAMLARVVRQANARLEHLGNLNLHLRQMQRSVDDAMQLAAVNPSPIIVVDDLHAIRSCNQAAADLLEIELADAVSSPLPFPLDGSERQDVLITHQSGEELRLQVEVRPIRWENKPARLLVMQDTTMCHHIEIARQRLFTAIEQCMESVLITDCDGVIQYANPAFHNISGYSSDEAIGQNPRLLKSGKHDAAFYEHMWHCIHSHDSWQGRMINRRKNGSLFEEDASISAVRNEGGEIVSFVAVKRDVTHMVELEDQLRQSQKMQAVGRLAGGIAHDFNNLLTVIMGQCQLLLMRHAEDEALRAKIEQIRIAADRASGLTRQLLSFSRKNFLKKQRLDLNRLIHDFQKMLRRLIGEDVLLTVDLQAGPATVDGDPGQLEQVVMNLVVNARDAMPDGGSLVIHTQNFVCDHDGEVPGLTAGHYVTMSVRDTGCGMDPDTLSLIFEPFFTTKEKDKGTGLGLATVYAIVQQLNGHVTVDSEEGKGSTFKVYLPLQKGLAEDDETTDEQLEETTHGELILLVEDEEGVREMAREMLSVQGYRVVMARSPAEALEICRSDSNKFDLLLTDVVMPGMNGIEMARRLTEQFPSLPVLFMSGYTDRYDDAAQTLNSHHDFIQKPFTPQELGRKVKTALERA